MCTAIGLENVVPEQLGLPTVRQESIDEARSGEFKLTTVPSGKIPGLESFYVWTPSMGFYVVFVWVCALLIDSGRLRDVCFYMSVVAAVDIGLFYLVKRGRHGAEVRGGLTRAFFAAERVRRLAERAPNTHQDQWQPDSKDSNEPVPVGVGGTAP